MSFWIAFAAGLAVLWVFAGDQFNRRSWAEEERLGRILTALNPNDLRGVRAKRRAFTVYLVLITLLYCALQSVRKAAEMG